MLQAGTILCPVCGVQQRAQAAPVDMHGGYPGYARQQVVPQPVPQMVPSPPASQSPVSYGVSNTDSAPPSSGRSAQRIASMYALGEAFVGSPAGVGTRMLSLLIDLVVIAGVGVGAWLLSSSWILGVVAGLEVAIIFTVTQARTGASLGKLVTRTRVSRADAPQSPGLVRAGVRSAITGAGALLAAVGAFIVELTAAADSSGKRRTIADRAARTVVVSIPTEQARIEAEEVAQEAAHSEYLATLSGSGMELAADGAASGGVAAGIEQLGGADIPGVVTGAGAPDAGAPGLGLGRPNAGVNAPYPPDDVPGPRRTSAVIGHEPDRAPGPRRRTAADALANESREQPTELPAIPPAPATPATPVFPATLAAQPVVPSAPAAQPVVPAAPAAPATAEPRRRTRTGGQTVLTFDTGQREVVAANSIVALGRAPSATGGEDQLIVVTDSSMTISKNHARWEEDRGGVWVTDLGSTNGTELIYADGRTQVLTPGVRTSAQGVARIRLGDRTFTMSPLNGGSA